MADILLQGTPDWHRARLGYFSGSRIYDLLGKPKTKDAQFSQTALSYIYEVMGERLLSPDFVGNDAEFGEWLRITHRTSFEMDWGHEWEGPAKLDYIIKTKREITETESIKHKTIEWFSASPDGLVLDGFDIEGVVEVKCPQLKNLSKYFTEINDNETLKKVNPQYYYQVQAEYMVTGAQWADFIVYHPHTRPKIKCVRILPDIEAQELITEKVTLANQYIQEQISKLQDNG